MAVYRRRIIHQTQLQSDSLERRYDASLLYMLIYTIKSRACQQLISSFFQHFFKLYYGYLVETSLRIF